MTKPVIGEQMADGSVYGGLTRDGKHHIYAMPKDLSLSMIFNEAAKAVKQLNAGKALGHSDWQIGSMEVMRVLKDNQSEGALKDTFKTDYKATSGYWTSTQVYDPQLGDNLAYVLVFNKGLRPDSSPLLKDMPKDTMGMPADILRAMIPKRSVRPVRLVPVSKGGGSFTI
jgi:hypothetical protein